MAVKITNKPEAQKPALAKAKKSPRGKRITNKSYPLSIYEKLFAYVASGEDLTTACKHQHMPSPWTVRRRLAVDDKLNDQYLAAQKIRLHGMADQLVSLPDEAIKGYEKVSAADRLTASKQKGDNIKWLLQRGLAEYAMAGEDGGQAVTVNLINSPDVAPAAGAAPFVPAGQPVLKIVGGTKPADDSSAEQGNG